MASTAASRVSAMLAPINHQISRSSIVRPERAAPAAMWPRAALTSSGSIPPPTITPSAISPARRSPRGPEAAR